MTAQEQLQESPKKKGIHPWVWGGILFWGAVLGMNAHFLIKAIEVKPEMVVDNYYEQGLIQDQRNAEKLAWVESGIQVQVQKSQEYWTVKLNKTVNQISGQLYRASNKEADIQVNPQLNTQELKFTRPSLEGSWDLQLRVQHEGQWMTYTKKLSL